MTAKPGEPGGGEEETLEQVKAKLAEKTAQLENASSELAQNREAKATIEGERDALKLKVEELTKAPKPPATPPDGAEAAAAAGAEAARKVLADSEKASIDTNAKAAEAAFKARYPEFATDNDQGGLKFGAVLARYKAFNTTGLKSVDEFSKLLEDAYTLVNPQRTVAPVQPYTPYAHSSAAPGRGPKPADASKLSSQERAIVERLGWTEEQFLKQKEKRPHYIASLLKTASE